MNDIGNNQGKGRKCECGDEGVMEHIGTCEKVVEKMKSKMRVELVESDTIEHLERAQKWIEEYLLKRDTNSKKNEVND